MDEYVDLLGYDDDLLGDYDDDDDDDLVGDDDDDLLGRRRRRRRRRRRGKSSRGARALLRQNVAPGVAKPGLKRLVLGMGNQTLGSTATTVTFTVRPQIAIKVQKLLILETNIGAVAPGVSTVTVMNVGNASQFAGSGAVPVATFGPTVYGNVLHGDVAEPGVDLTMTVVRTIAPGGTATVEYSGAIIGEAVA